jgi:hypothetical protein
MERFEDRGLPYDVVIDRVYSPEDAGRRRALQFNQVSGILKGRPTELLKGA